MKEFGIYDPSVNYKEREGSYGVAIQQDSVLLEVARLGYFLPGGGVEEKEAPEEALQREFREESGYELCSWKGIGTAVEYRKTLKKISHFYIVELGVRGKPTYQDGHIFPVEWISVKDAKKGLYLESQRWAIEKVVK